MAEGMKYEIIWDNRAERTIQAEQAEQFEQAAREERAAREASKAAHATKSEAPPTPTPTPNAEFSMTPKPTEPLHSLEKGNRPTTPATLSTVPGRVCPEGATTISGCKYE